MFTEISLQYLKTLEGTKIRRTYSSKSDKNLVKKENLKKGKPFLNKIWHSLNSS